MKKRSILKDYLPLVLTSAPSLVHARTFHKTIAYIQEMIMNPVILRTLSLTGLFALAALSAGTRSAHANLYVYMPTSGRVLYSDGTPAKNYYGRFCVVGEFKYTGSSPPDCTDFMTDETGWFHNRPINIKSLWNDGELLELSVSTSLVPDRINNRFDGTYHRFYYSCETVPEIHWYSLSQAEPDVRCTQVLNLFFTLPPAARETAGKRP